MKHLPKDAACPAIHFVGLKGTTGFKLCSNLQSWADCLVGVSRRVFLGTRAGSIWKTMTIGQGDLLGQSSQVCPHSLLQRTLLASLKVSFQEKCLRIAAGSCQRLVIIGTFWHVAVVCASLPWQQISPKIKFTWTVELPPLVE